MKHVKHFSPVAILFTAALFAFFAGCGGDDSPTSSSSGGWPPNITMTPGQKFTYTNDSITSGGTHMWTKRGSVDVVQAQTSIGGQSCYPFAGFTYDSSTTPPTPTPEIYYVRYDAGIFYQYGVRNLINPGQPLTWDVVGNFNVSRKTSYNIADVSYSINIPPFGLIPFSGPLKGNVADSTIIRTTSNGENIYCYRVELNANISGTLAGVTVTGNIFIDYYIGYTDAAHPSNPVGLVELNLKPFSFTATGGLNIPEPGYDRKLYSHANP